MADKKTVLVDGDEFIHTIELDQVGDAGPEKGHVTHVLSPDQIAKHRPMFDSAIAASPKPTRDKVEALEAKVKGAA